MTDLDEISEIERLNRELALITRMLVEERKIFYSERARVRELENIIENMQIPPTIDRSTAEPTLTKPSTRSEAVIKSFKNRLVKLLKLRSLVK